LSLVLVLALGPFLASCGPFGPPARPSGSSASASASASASRPAPAAEDGPGADLLDVFERQVAEAIERVRGSAVELEYTAADAPRGVRRVASGVVVSPEGDVLSVRVDPPPSPSPAEQIVARDVSGRRLGAAWVAADPETGLTLLRIAPGVARPAVPAPRGARLGLPVLVVGNPFGYAHSVSRGAVSGLDRRVEYGRTQLGGLIQVDASIHPGDNGALLADLRGGWLGVIRSGLSAPGPDTEKPREKDRDKEKDTDRDKDKDREGEKPQRAGGGTSGREHDHDLGFAIPARDALWVAEQLRAHRHVDRAFLGVTMHLPPPPTVAPPGPPDADAKAEAKAKAPETASAPAFEPEGVSLDEVLPDTPAERAGLKAGDRIVTLNGQLIHTPYDLTDRLARTSAGSEVTVELVRGRGPGLERRSLTLRTGRRPPPPASVSKLGPKEKARPASNPGEPEPEAPPRPKSKPRAE
jgi:S1-C subfamily serine protease